MNKYTNTLKFELKSIVRDKMTLLMLLFPLMILILSTVVIPNLLKSTDNASPAAIYGSLFAFIMFVSFGTIMIAALLAFVLLDRKDDKTLFTIATTPISIGGYLKFQATYHYLLSVLFNIIILIGTKLIASDAYVYEMGGITVNLFGDLTYPKILVFSFISSMYIPAYGFFLGAIANNKIEGFAYIKFSGFLIMIPLLLVLQTFSDGLQYVLGITPNFWSIKGLLISVMPSNEWDISFWLYMLIGGIYSLGLSIPAYKYFIKKSIHNQ